MKSEEHGLSQFQMEVEKAITDFSFKPVDYRQSATTAFEVEWVTTLPYERGSYLIVDIDSS
jgi:hypothetical protein